MRDDRRWHRPHSDLWTYHVPLRLLGTDAGRRGTVVRDASGGWTFVGPVPLTADAHGELAAVGRVNTLVVPTAFHNRFVPEACEAFPAARVLVARGAKRERLPAERTRALEAGTVGGTLGALPVPGMRLGHEVVFVHGSSGTLVVADLFMHFPTPGNGPWTRLFRRLFGWTPGLRVPTLMRRALGDREAVCALLEGLRGRGLRRIVVAHGEPYEDGDIDDIDDALGRLADSLR